MFPIFGRISTKITLVVFAINLLLALGITSLQLYREFQSDVNMVRHSLQQIRISYLAPLEAGAFALDMPLLQTHLDGIGRLPGIRCARIELDKGGIHEILRNEFCQETPPPLRQSHILQTKVSGNRFNLGKLVIHFSYDLAWTNLHNRLLFVIGTNVLQTFLAALVILGILHRLVSRPLSSLRKQLEILGEHGQYTLPQKRVLRQPDELNLLVLALNERQTTISKLVAHLRESNEELAKILNVISHDLRTPMVNLSGFSQESLILLDDLPPSAPIPADTLDQLKQNLSRTRQNAEVFHAQLVGLGKYLRILDIPLSFRECSVLELWNATCSLYSLSIARTGATIQTDFQSLSCWVDSDAMINILGQLLENALKFYAPDRHPEILAKSGKGPTGDIWVCLEDCGIGISPQESELIFGLFYRSSNQSEGVGLGLSIAQKLATRMGGRIRAERKDPQGLRMIVNLPASIP